MRQLLPDVRSAVDLFECYRPPRPRWLRLDMVVSVDGAATDEQGRTAALGGVGDQEVFRTLRAHADVILVGAGTARAEGYGPHRVRADLGRRRTVEGLRPAAAIAVVSGSLDLDFTSPLFTAAAERTLVVTCAVAPQTRRAAAAAVADVIVAGEEHVDLLDGIAALRERGHERILCEGGPTLCAGLLRAGAVDEVCVTVAPELLPAVATRMVTGEVGRIPLRLDLLLEHGGELYARYRVTEPMAQPST